MTHNYASPLLGTLVIKYGGNALAEAGSGLDPVLAEIAGLRARGARVVLVHGGGPQIDAALAREGAQTTRIDGLRVTDARTLEITEAVLCGTINKALVRACAAHGIRAAGVSGQDAALLTSEIVRAELGYVGEIARVNPHLLHVLLDGALMPVVAPLAIAAAGGSALNVNADGAAAAIAAAMRADAFVAITNVERVRRDPNDPNSGIAALSLEEATAFASTDACGSGMKPKLAAAVAAVRGGCRAAYVCAARIGAIAGAIERGDATRIVQNAAA